MNKVLIKIPMHTAVWRYDQIAALEIVNESMLRVVPAFVTDDLSQFEYEYDDLDEAKKAFDEVLAEWRAICETPTTVFR